MAGRHKARGAPREAAWIAAVCAAVLCSLAFAQQPIVLDDFEDGPERWIARDSEQPEETAPARLISFFQSNRVPEGGGKHSLFVLFHDAEDSWATLSLPVNGQELARKKITAISFWLRGDGSSQPVDVVLSAWPDEQTELAYSTTIALDSRQWVPVVIPLDRFVRQGKPIGEDLALVRFFQFKKTGTWQSLSFRVDEIQALTGEVSAPAEVPELPAGVRSYTLEADFTGQGILPFRTSFGANFDITQEVEWTDKLQSAAEALGAQIIRVTVPVPQSEGEEQELLRRLDTAVERLLEVAATVMICIDAPLSPELDDRAVADFAARLVARYNVERRARVVYWEIFDEPLLLTEEDLSRAIKLFNRAAARMKVIDRNIRIGGMSLAYADEEQLSYIMNKANHLSFCSWHFYGTHLRNTSDRDLMAAAVDGMTYGTPNQASVQQVERLLQQAGLTSGLLFITECNANAKKTETGAAEDPRLSQPFNAAWFAALAMTIGPQVDLLLASHLVGEGWGVLDPQGNTGPAYWAIRLLMKYAPRGRWMCPVKGTTRTLRAMALKDRKTGECCLVLANLTNDPVALRVVARGLPQRCAAEFTAINEACDGLVSMPLNLEWSREPAAPKPEARVRYIPLGPYGVGVVHFHRKLPTLPAPQ